MTLDILSTSMFNFQPCTNSGIKSVFFRHPHTFEMLVGRLPRRMELVALVKSGEGDSMLIRWRQIEQRTIVIVNFEKSN